MKTEIASSCPLCGSAAELHHADGPRRYFQCSECTLIHVDPDRRLAPEQALQHLQRQHEGEEKAERMVFLKRLTDPLLQTVPAGSHGLDYGCGPDAALAHILTGLGRPCGAYDPSFFPDEDVLGRTYDFVVSAEALDHTADPAATFALLGRLVVPRGIIGILTRFHDGVPFRNWWYRREPVRVCFYAESTMRWIAWQNDWQVRFPAPGIALFRVRAGRG